MAEEGDKKGETIFSAGETTLLVAIMQNLTSDIQFDAEAVAQKLGYKDGSIVKTRWGQIKRKKINNANGSSPNGVTKRTPKKGGKAAAKAPDGEDEDLEVETPAKTPAKRGHKPTAKKMEAALTEEDGEGEGDGEGKVKAEEDEGLL